MSDNEKTAVFMENYEKLLRVAEELRAQETPDIDQLIPKVDEALEAWKICKGRIQSVEKMIEAREQEASNSE